MVHYACVLKARIARRGSRAGKEQAGGPLANPQLRAREALDLRVPDAGATRGPSRTFAVSTFPLPSRTHRKPRRPQSPSGGSHRLEALRTPAGQLQAVAWPVLVGCSDPEPPITRYNPLLSPIIPLAQKPARHPRGVPQMPPSAWNPCSPTQGQERQGGLLCTHRAAPWGPRPSLGTSSAAGRCHECGDIRLRKTHEALRGRNRRAIEVGPDRGGLKDSNARSP